MKKGEYIMWEWVALWIDDEYGDIQFRSEHMTYAEALGRGATEIELVRDLCCPYDGIVDRQFADVVDGKLPEKMDGGARIPKRMRDQLKDSPVIVLNRKVA